MPYVISRDGTRIAYETKGVGPALILVDGAMCFRASGPMGALAEQLESRFTLYLYDRRGRGESGNTLPYAPDREVEDIGALVEAAGGSASVFGISSGGALALKAAQSLPGIRKVAIYEVPFVVDDQETPLDRDFRARLHRHLERGERGAAVKQFMRRVRVPAVAIFGMRLMPFWKTLTGIAHTLPYDIELLEPFSKGLPIPRGTWDAIAVPVLVVAGGKSPAWMRNAQAAIAATLPSAEIETLPGQTHMVKASALAPLIERFLTGRDGQGARESGTRFPAAT